MLFDCWKTLSCQGLAMLPGDRAILRFLRSPRGIILISLVLPVGGLIYILMTGRWELGFWVMLALLPWVEYWWRRKRK
jgi:hypothetical protein